jgi:hypothetical protein
MSDRAEYARRQEQLETVRAAFYRSLAALRERGAVRLRRCRQCRTAPHVFAVVDLNADRLSPSSQLRRMT